MRGKGGRKRLRLVLFLAAVMAGFLYGLRLPEERRSRLRRLLFEAKEMPFRVFA